MTMQPADGARRTPRSAANGPQLAPRAGLSSDHRHRDGMPRRVDPGGTAAGCGGAQARKTEVGPQGRPERTSDSTTFNSLQTHATIQASKAPTIAP